jgi:hypothetical protein
VDRIRVLVAGRGRMLAGSLSSLPDLAVEWETDTERAIQLLVLGVLDVGVVEEDLGGAASGTDLVRAAIQRGCTVPLVVVTNTSGGGVEETALRAGAAACVDLSRCRVADLGWRVAFAHAGRLHDERRVEAKLMDGVNGLLGDHCKDILADIDRSTEALVRALSQDSPDRGICQEIQGRLRTFHETVDAVTLAARLRVSLAEARDTFSSAPPAEAAQPSSRRSSRRQVVARGADSSAP